MIINELSKDGFDLVELKLIFAMSKRSEKSQI